MERAAVREALDAEKRLLKRLLHSHHDLWHAQQCAQQILSHAALLHVVCHLGSRRSSPAHRPHRTDGRHRDGRESLIPGLTNSLRSIGLVDHGSGR